MFRFNNPDALLVLLHGRRGVRDGARDREGRHPVAACWPARSSGFAFLTKMLQAFSCCPALALAYLVAAPTGLWRRIRQLLAAGLAMVVVGRLVVRAVELWPASSPALHRRLDRQQRPRARARLQRPRPDLRPGPAAAAAARRHGRSARGCGGAAAAGAARRSSRRTRRRRWRLRRQRRADAAVQRPSSAARSPGCCPPRSRCSSPAWC